MIKCSLSLQILKQAIDYPKTMMGYEVKDIDPPKLTIYTKNAKPGSESMDKPKIEILGLNVECIFNNLPSKYVAMYYTCAVNIHSCRSFTSAIYITCTTAPQGGG